MQLKHILAEVKNYIFPSYCLKCHKEGEWVCAACFARLDFSGVYCCPRCHKISQAGRNCEACKDKVDSFLTAQIALAAYEEDSLLGNIIRSLKYYYADDLKLIIDKIIAEFLARTGVLNNFDYIVPIPLHRKRLAERGFNQAEIIAKILARHLDKPMSQALDRVRQTLQQAKLSREARLKNLVDAFKIKEKISGNILLVDDVFTTGSTMQEAAKVLREAGVNKVVGFSLARG